MIKGFTVFKQELAGYLMQKGYPLIAAVPNRKKQGYLVFHFADSAELREEIEEYKSMKEGFVE